METLILVICAFIVGWKASEFIHVISFKKILEDLKVSEKDLRKLHSQLAEQLGDSEDAEKAQPDAKTIVDIKVEQHQGQLYAFEVDKDTFIAQGQNGDELLNRILEKYPVNYRVICDRTNGGDLIADAVERKVKNG
jgi:hypothetical protein